MSSEHKNVAGLAEQRFCEKHPDVPYVVREGTSVNGGHIGWGCAVCNMLRVEALRDALRPFAAAAPEGQRRWDLFNNGGFKPMEARDAYMNAACARLCMDDFRKAEKEWVK